MKVNGRTLADRSLAAAHRWQPFDAVSLRSLCGGVTAMVGVVEAQPEDLPACAACARKADEK